MLPLRFPRIPFPFVPDESWIVINDWYEHVLAEFLTISFILGVPEVSLPTQSSPVKVLQSVESFANYLREQLVSTPDVKVSHEGQLPLSLGGREDGLLSGGQQ